MNVKIQGSELNRMMKIISQCINDKMDQFSNVEITYADNFLTVHGANGIVNAVMSTPLLGGDGETFCVDGMMFAKVCALCNGDVVITSNEKDCCIKGNGRARLSVINAKVTSYSSISGKKQTVTVKAEDFSNAYGCVAHAVSGEDTRPMLTGVLLESDGAELKMTAIDGFRMASETIVCEGDQIRIVIPNSFMKLVQNSTYPGETICISTDEKRVEASTDYMKIVCGLLIGDFPDTSRIVPTEFKTECRLNADQFRSVLKNCCVLNTKSKLVKMVIGSNAMKVMSNSENADYEADIDCDTHGPELKIAFNQKYLTETINSVDTEDIIMKFNTMASPCVTHGNGGNGTRLILPVRTAG